LYGSHRPTDVKLSDLGAARNVKPKEDYTYIATTDHMPWRWMPLEVRPSALSAETPAVSRAMRTPGELLPQWLRGRWFQRTRLAWQRVSVLLGRCLRPF